MEADSCSRACHFGKKPSSGGRPAMDKKDSVKENFFCGGRDRVEASFELDMFLVE